MARSCISSRAWPRRTRSRSCPASPRSPLSRRPRRWPLAARDDALAVIPAPLDDERSRAASTSADAAAIIKLGRHFARVRALLGRLGLAAHARYVERASLGNERVLPLDQVAPETVPYFSMILCHRRGAGVAMSAELPHGAAVVVLGSSAVPLGRRIAAHLPGARLHAPRGSRDRSRRALSRARAASRSALCRRHADRRPLRRRHPDPRAWRRSSRDKRASRRSWRWPRTARVAVPLLGGHRGANALARADRRARAAAAPRSPRRAISRSAWRSTSRRPAGASADPERIQGARRRAHRRRAGRARGRGGRCRLARRGAARVCAATRRTPSASPTARQPPDERALVLHPPVLALGVGCARDCPPDELQRSRATSARGARIGRGRGRAGRLARSQDGRAGGAGSRGDARRAGAVLRGGGFARRDAAAPESVRRRIPRGRLLWRRRGRGARRRGRRRRARRARSEVSPHATCAVARAAAPLDPQEIGRARGRLSIVGIGPGDAALAHRGSGRGARRVERHRRIAALSRSAGAGGAPARSRHDERAWATRRGACGRALDLAAAGRHVASRLVGRCRHLWPREPRFRIAGPRASARDWARIEIAVVPGLSALQAAAARLGAPFGHDFCAISLSDLLTPWPAIERRLEAAASADFVVALYNPRSSRRQAQLDARARDPARARAGPRRRRRWRAISAAPGERVVITTLAELDEAEIDMLTLVIVGSSATRASAGPRAAALHAARISPAVSANGPLHRRRPRRARPHHRARAAPRSSLPGLPLCRLARAARRSSRPRPRARASSTRRP